jgi:hypothetical protein
MIALDTNVLAHAIVEEARNLAKRLKLQPPVLAV